MRVTPKTYPIASVKVVISDPQYRWPEVVLIFDPKKIPASVSWDRRFADGTLAPSGWYRVIAIACDVHDLCGSDEGIIEIPVTATSMATLAPSLTTTITMTFPATLTATQMPATPAVAFSTPTPAITPEPTRPKPSIPYWQLLGLIGLMIVIASASVVDPRPEAMRQLGEVMDHISNRNQLDSSQDEN